MSTQFPRKWSQQSSQNWLVLTIERHDNVRYFKCMGKTGPETKFIFKRFLEGCAQNMTQCNERHGWSQDTSIKCKMVDLPPPAIIIPLVSKKKRSNDNIKNAKYFNYC